MKSKEETCKCGDVGGGRRRIQPSQEAFPFFLLLSLFPSLYSFFSFLLSPFFFPPLHLMCNGPEEKSTNLFPVPTVMPDACDSQYMSLESKWVYCVQMGAQRG